MEDKDKYDLLIMRSSFLKKSFKIVKETAEKANILFNKYMILHMENIELNKETVSSTVKINTENTEEKEIEGIEGRTEFEKKEKERFLKNAFKQIALKIHPDKLERLSDFEKGYKLKLFEKATEAFQNDDFHDIIEISEELGLPIDPLTKKQITMIKESNKKLETKIDTLKRSVVWGWYHAEAPEKEKIMEKYIAHVQKSNIRS